MLLGLVLLGCELPADGNSENNGQDGSKIIFDANGGEGSMASVAFNGETIRLPQNGGEISRTNFYFISWNTQSDRSGTEYIQQAYVDPQDNDLTLYAQWYKIYNIGDIGPGGGIVFYRHPIETSPIFYYPEFMYLEAAPKSTEGSKPWGKYPGRAIYTSNSIGSGLENTDLIIAAYEGEDYAAHYCKNLISTNGTDDWYLPNRLELTYMSANLYDNVSADFNTASDAFYWSSYEKVENAPNPITNNYAYIIQFNGSMSYINTRQRDLFYHVRAARRF